MDSGFMQLPISSGLDSLLNEESYKNFLRLTANLHEHSLQNKVLIALQFPESSLVLNYGRWNECKREIVPYCNGITVLAPKYKIKYRYNDTGKPVKVKDMTKEELQESIRIGLVTPVRKIDSYAQATIYDIKQTVLELASTTDTAPEKWVFDFNLDRLAKAIKEGLGISVNIENSQDTFGIYESESNSIILMGNKDKRELSRALIHCAIQSQIKSKADLYVEKQIIDSIEYAIECNLGMEHSTDKFEFINDWRIEYQKDSAGAESIHSYISEIASVTHKLLSIIEHEYEVDNRFKAIEILEDAMREEMADDVLSEASANAIQALLGG